MVEQLNRKERLAQIAQAIDATRDRNGCVTPDGVLKAARNPKSILHDEFEWNDKTAAEKQRLDRARKLIVEYRVQVVIKNHTIVTPVYVRDPRLPSKEQGYVALTSEEMDRDLATRIVVAEFERCESAIERARGVAGTLENKFPGLCGELENLLGQLVEMREQLQAAE